MNDQNTPQPDTVGGAFVQELAPDQYEAYAARGAEQTAAGTCGRALSTGQPCPDHPQPTITPAAAAHVLWQENQGGYPAGPFTTALLKAWWLADDENSLTLSLAFPAYGAAIDLLRTADGVARLRAIAGGEQR